MISKKSKEHFIYFKSQAKERIICLSVTLGFSQHHNERSAMKIKLIFSIVCSLLLLSSAPVLAQGVGETQTTGEIGFLDKNPPKPPPETEQALTNGEQLELANGEIPAAGDNKQAIPLFVGLSLLSTIGIAVLTARLLKKKKI